ncbi:hypothetical protein OC845_006508, partial [Tilletia horrida]
MVTDLNLSDHQFQALLTIFYVRKYVASCIFIWGLSGALQAAAQNWTLLMFCRFFLGVAESGFSSGAAYYFSNLYPRHEAGFRFSLFIAAGPFASSWSGTLAYAVLRVKRNGTLIDGWRLLFLLEGLVPIIFAPVVWFYLPNNTSTAWFLTERERKIASARLFNDNLQLFEITHEMQGEGRAGDQAHVTHGDGADVVKLEGFSSFRHIFSFKDAVQALKYPLCWVTSLLFFTVSLVLSPFAVYLPSILEGMGYTMLQSQGYSVPPYLVAFAISIGAAYVCDRYGGRGIVSALV